MEEHSTHRALLRQVADRLMDEYAGTLPPGQVLVAVFKANHSLGLNHGISSESRLIFCESFARQVLTKRVGADTRVPFSLAS